MQLQTYAKIGIIVGIGVMGFFSIMIGITMSDNLRESFILTFLDKEAKMAEIKELSSVVAFTEKYPDSYMTENNRRHNTEIEIFAYDFETGNQLRLNVNYDIWDERFHEYIRCNIEDNQYRNNLGVRQEFAHTVSDLNYPQIFLSEGRAEDQFVVDFIKYTNCLEMGEEKELVRKVSFPEYGDTPTVRISVPQGSSVPGCEEIAHCFEPEEITIKVGDIVEWKNYDDAAHTVTSGGPDVGPTELFDSGLAMADELFTIKFDVAGEYPYFCMIHPWQTGTITVVNDSNGELENQ